MRMQLFATELVLVAWNLKIRLQKFSRNQPYDADRPRVNNIHLLSAHEGFLQMWLCNESVSLWS